MQGAIIDPSALRGFEPEAETCLQGDALRDAVRKVAVALARAQRPVIMPGTGVRIAGAYAEFLKLVEALNFPVATAFNAHDLLPDTHPCYVGKPGTVGDRAGNFAVQNADCVLVLGCRLNIRQISYNWESFAPDAFRIMVDVDAAELAKPTLNIQLPVHADLKIFLTLLNQEMATYAPSPAQRDYLGWCMARRHRYPVVLPEYLDDAGGVNPYIFAEALFDALGETDVVATANATACVTTFQAAKLQAGQRMFSNSGSASMGYDLPAAIGAAYAAPERRIICLAGDGSIMMNLQELQSIIAQRLNIKIFLLNNAGYGSIRQTQTAYFSDNMFGCDPRKRHHLSGLPAYRRGVRIPGAPDHHPCRPHRRAGGNIAWRRAAILRSDDRPRAEFRPQTLLTQTGGRPHGVLAVARHGAIPLPRGTGRKHVGTKA